MTERKHLPALDGLRAVAVLIVIVYHAGVLSHVPGDLGVTAFFVLSGFLITWLLIREFTATSDISIRSFYLRRVLRIFPAYYVFIGLSFAVDTLRHHPWGYLQLGAALTYLYNYYNAFHGHPAASTSHAWSLAVEEQFYLLWPAVFLLVWPRGRRYTMWVLAAIILVAATWRSSAYLLLHLPAAYVYNAFGTRCDALAIGCFVAAAASNETYQRLVDGVRSRSWLPLIPLAALFVGHSFESAKYHYSAGMTVDALLLAVFIVQLLGLSETAMWSWLNHPVTRWLGLISYPSYLWHVWAIDAGLHLAGKNHRWEAFVASYAVTIVLASISYYLVERPFLRLKRRRGELPMPVPFFVNAPAPATPVN